jgi:cytochrome c biogenesis protein CcdA
MSTGWLRAIVGIVVFFVALAIGLSLTGALDATPDPNTGLIAARNTIIVLFGIALVLGFVAYAATEYAQTKRLDSITSQFDTRSASNNCRLFRTKPPPHAQGHRHADHRSRQPEGWKRQDHDRRLGRGRPG